MGKIYPYWLGYRYRNVDKIGQDPEEKIEKAILRDKAYFDKLPQNSKKRKLYASYRFDELDPKKIAEIFRENRGITPYEFVKKFDFDRRDLVCKDQKQIDYNVR